MKIAKAIEAILKEYYENKGQKVVTFFCSQMTDAADLIGLPHKNEKTGKTEFLPPYWFPTDDQPVVLFLDELNRSNPVILQCVMDLALNHTLAGKSLPKGSRIISAVNDGDNYQLTDLDPALVSRFNIVSFKPTVEEWLLWAKKNDLDSRVIEFIEENHIWLDKEPDANTGLDKTPDRRAWKKVSDIIKNAENLTGIYAKAISSIVGPKAASAFISSVAARKIVSGKEVLLNFAKVATKLKGYQLHELSTVNDGIFRHLEVEIVKPSDKEKAKKNVNDYFDFLTKEKKEAAAHFANLYVSATYPNAVKFLARECPLLTMGMVAYVQSIR